MTWVNDSTRVNFWRLGLDSSHVEKNGDSIRVTLRKTVTRFESRFSQNDSTRVTVNDSRLQSESFLQILWVPDGQTHFVCNLHQRWADIDFSTPDPNPKKFCIFASDPYPKISEIWYPISIRIRMRRWLNTQQTGSGFRLANGPSFLKTYSSVACNMTLIHYKCAVDCTMFGKNVVNLTL